MDNFHGDSGTRTGFHLVRNVFEMVLDGVLCYSHFVGDFFIGPAVQEMLNDCCFACGQAKLLLCLNDGMVLPPADPDLTYHNEDSCLRVGLINQSHTTKEHGAVESVHEASELNLLPVRRIGPDFQKLLDLIDEICDSWREPPICRFSVLGANDILAQFPCPPILIEYMHRSRQEHDARPNVRDRQAFLMVDREIIYNLFHEVLLE